ncbi:MAG: hypothetical protein AAGA67_05435 [Cyanobacteria bacterium P01_F01_bin.153]
MRKSLKNSELTPYQGHKEGIYKNYDRVGSDFSPRDRPKVPIILWSIFQTPPKPRLPLSPSMDS